MFAFQKAEESIFQDWFFHFQNWSKPTFISTRALWVNTFVDLSCTLPKLQKVTEPDQNTVVYSNIDSINNSKAF